MEEQKGPVKNLSTLAAESSESGISKAIKGAVEKTLERHGLKIQKPCETCKPPDEPPAPAPVAEEKPAAPVQNLGPKAVATLDGCKLKLRFDHVGDLMMFNEAVVPDKDRTPEMRASHADFITKVQADYFDKGQPFERELDFTAPLAMLAGNDSERLQRIARFIVQRPGTVVSSAVHVFRTVLEETYAAVKNLDDAVRTHAPGAHLEMNPK